MDNLVYILFICLVAPMLLMVLMLRKRSRLLVGYMVIGICVSLFVSELNTLKVIRRKNRNEHLAVFRRFIVMNFVRQNPYTFAFIHPDFFVAENGIHTSFSNKEDFKRTLAVGNAEDIVVFKCCVVIRFAVFFFKKHIITLLKIVKFFCYYKTYYL